MCLKEERLGLEAIVEWIELNFHHIGLELNIELKRKRSYHLPFRDIIMGDMSGKDMTTDKVLHSRTKC